MIFTINHYINNQLINYIKWLYSDILWYSWRVSWRYLQDPQLWETLVGFVLQHSHLLVPLLDGPQRPLLVLSFATNYMSHIPYVWITHSKVRYVYDMILFDSGKMGNTIPDNTCVTIVILYIYHNSYIIHISYIYHTISYNILDISYIYHTISYNIIQYHTYIYISHI